MPKDSRLDPEGGPVRHTNRAPQLAGVVVHNGADAILFPEDAGGAGEPLAHEEAGVLRELRLSLFIECLAQCTASIVHGRTRLIYVSTHRSPDLDCARARVVSVSFLTPGLDHAQERIPPLFFIQVVGEALVARDASLHIERAY